MSARHARRTSRVRISNRPLRRYVYRGEQVQVFVQPTITIRELWRAGRILLLFLPAGFLTAILLTGGAWLGVDAVTTHLVVSTR